MLKEMTSHFSNNDWWASIQNLNPAVWILGHIAAVRKITCMRCGINETINSFDKMFLNDTNVSHVLKTTLPEQIFESLHHSEEVLVNYLKKIKQEDLLITVTMKNGSQTSVDGILSYFIWHESYHLGQLSTIKILLNKNE